VARDRKRAKQRRDRAGGTAGRAAQAAATPQQPVRSDLPGSLDHASAEVDEFDAALLRGAGGVPATEDTDLPTGATQEQELPSGEEDQNELPTGAEDALQAPPSPPGGGGGSGGGGGRGGGGLPEERPSGAPIRGGNRAVGFLRASWAELQRVQWPDRRQVFQATAVVLGFVAIAGAYLGLADFVAKEIVEAIL
jgi:preprotein translocase subunit SecE